MGLLLEDYSPRITFLRQKTMRDLLEIAANTWGVTVADIKAETRKHPYVFARHEFCWLAYQEGRWSLVQIGRQIGRDHTSVLFGIKAHEKRSAPDYVPYQRHPPMRAA